ncbi:substrate-binding periplasmic protein [Suttonella indologenes]|uniref:Sulfate starvation-induced protein 7 n=1 Tax=Suttonella indologenes TaxID=13276 RepID=A0A380MKG3_9GAMM|nr:transporter substrate-binding domain-containing protein [Suttonella indologenes]SUO92121.1 Sulfate starvation-induced protein 7 [Suttonella indologenes]
MFHSKKILQVLSCALLFSSLTAQAQTPGHYQMLRVLHVEPLSYMSDEGKIAGFESDLIAEIKKRSGLDIREEVIGSISQGFDSLQAGKADVMAAALSITAEREKIFLYSEPYFIGSPLTIVTKDESIKTWQDLKDKTVMVQGGFTHEKWLKELKAEHDNDGSIKSVPTSFLAVKDVIRGKADATINDDIIILGYVNTYKEYNLKSVIDNTFGQDRIAFLINKNHPELKEKMDKTIKEMKADGTIDALLKKWWGDLFVK